MIAQQPLSQEIHCCKRKGPALYG